MAEFVGGALLSAFLDPLVQKLGSEVKEFFKGKDGILKLVKELKIMMSSADLLLIDAEEKLIKDQAVRKWLDDLKDTIYDADDLVYMIETEALEKKLEGESQSSYACCKVLMKLIPTPFTTFDKAIQPQIEEILEKLKLHLENKDPCLKRIEKQKHPERVCAPLLEESDVYGRDVEKEVIIKLLLSNDTIDNGDKLSVIPIVGMGGIGKTTLAQLAYNDDRVNKWFDTKVWVTVGDDEMVNSSKVMKTIIRKVTHNSNKCEIDEEQFELLNEVKKVLTGKKFFIVLDDVWDDDRNGWEVIKSSFVSGFRGSKILVTTRSNRVASIMETEPAHYLKVISFKDGWRLFAKCAGIDVVNSDEYSDLQVIGKKIVGSCKGLPLAIKSLGGLLRSKPNKEDWDETLNSDIWGLYDNNSIAILPALWLSYFYLPGHLKPCFTYFATFPKDYEFDKKDIILLWMAEGLLHPQKEKRIEEVGEEYFEDLISRSFFQPLSNRKKSVFHMHDLIHDLARFVSGEFCLGVDTKLSTCTHKIRHFSYKLDCQKDYEPKVFEELSEARCLRTFLWHQKLEPNQVWWSKIEHLPESFPRLRVLLIRNGLGFKKSYVLTKFPDSIGNLKYLRYLKLDCPFIEEIPNTICYLYNLEILLLEGCTSVIQLPTNIGNLTKLRHLCVPFSLEAMPLQFGKLKNLQELNTFIVGPKKACGIDLLKELEDLHGSLCLKGLQNVSGIEEVSGAILKSKKFLGLLCLEWSYGHEPGDLHKERVLLGALEPHPNLKEVKLQHYKGSGFPHWIGDHSFSNLARVELASCYNCTFLPPLGQLPSLKDLVITSLKCVVKIDSEFYYSTAATETKPFFRSLESLTFEFMEELQEWSFIEGGVFPLLKKLRFFRCYKLKVSLLPNYFPSLRELVIASCEQLMPLLPRAQPPVHAPFPSLEILEISYCDGQELLLEGELPLSLKKMMILGCRNLKDLDDEAFQHLTSLEKLEIVDCHNLRCLPNEMPISLFDLSIHYCKLLTSRVQRETGEDWPIIAHIPNISIKA
ncbi:putative disease resistance RPP13-like protein 1 [Humulus lupulus]|uniref:putative disease resistance RPP13-like protein 1 n=1 Tax=Humulus lupulus TaxID=3486 RepID=UPI002B403DF4|nr:putative disease resistance RPP13-like protein 1 [Humulus lupulus]XP_062115468.1 putative disease resistance RPP13-like protein 1 [Humulus lupulus]